MLSIGNGLRSSNLIFFTIQEYNEAELDNEIKDCFQMLSKRYKTSFLYGLKYILMDLTMHLFLGLYIKYFRPRILKDKEEGCSDDEHFIFTSSREDSQKAVSLVSPITGKSEKEKKHMTQSNVAQAMSSTWRQFEGGLAQKSFPHKQHVSPCLVRIICVLILFNW